MTEASSASRDRTLWTREITAPVREFLHTEAGSAGVLVAAIAAALIWANIDISSYNSFWNTTISVRAGSAAMTHDLRTWINSGLMTLFFLVVGLEARREFDLGDLRDRRRTLLPFAAGLAGMVIPVLIYLAVNHGGSGAHGWGAAMSTDTALALGLLALVGRGVPDRVRVFLLTIFVVDDLVSLVVLTVAYSERIHVMPLVVAIVAFGVLLAALALQVPYRYAYGICGIVMWAALFASGVEPVVAGLVIGLTASAYTPARGDLEEATGLFRLFREQPTAELARSATVGVTSALSPNARLQNIYHPWTSYVIVPIFGLANAGIAISGGFLAHAYASPVTLGILLSYVVGKPIAVVATSWLVTRFSRGRIRPPVGWAAVTGSGTIAGIGFTVALLIATLAFHGPQLAEAKVGLLSAGIAASLLTWAVFRVTAMLPPRRKALALLGEAEQLLDLIPPVDPDRDHFRGTPNASVTVVEYGDFQCPYCGQAEPIVRDLLSTEEVCYVWRHLPLTDVHPQAQLAAEAAEAAGEQGKFWEMHDLLLERQDRLRSTDLMAYAAELGLDTDRFKDALKRHVFSARIAQDVESADLSGVAGTPTFFINGQRHYGAYDIQTLKTAVKTARARAKINA